MTSVMCGPWQITFILAPLAPLTMFSPKLENIMDMNVSLGHDEG